MEVSPVDSGVAQDEFENTSALVFGRERNGEFLGHTTEDSFVNVLNAVRGAENADPLRFTRSVRRGQTVPVRHESDEGKEVSLFQLTWDRLVQTLP